MPVARPRSTLVALMALPALAGCARPVLSRDGQLVFQQKGAHGASVITANGVEFLDKTEIPRPVVRRSAEEPWRPATGFLMPADGVWRHTSTPLAVQGHGLAVVLRSSDVLVPSWGGEILIRLDVLAPSAAFPHAARSLRPAERAVIVIDGSGMDTVSLASVALDNLGAADRVGIVDASLRPEAAGAARPVLPLIPGSHHTLLRAAIERIIAQREPGGARRPVTPGDAPKPPGSDLAGALALARGWITTAPVREANALRQVLVLTDGAGLIHGASRLAQEAQALAAAGVEVTAVATDHVDPGALALLGGTPAGAATLDDRKDLVDHAFPPPGDVVLDDVTLSTSSVPAPARMVEVSGGDTALGLYADHLSLGQVYAGEARTEVARVALPPWVPGEPLELTLTATYRDVKSDRIETAHATLRCRYSDDVEQIAKARHGDVIAYASALAMVRRLHRAFLGSPADRPGGVRRLATMQATTLAELAQTQHDRALAAQAEMLTTLLAVIED